MFICSNLKGGKTVTYVGYTKNIKEQQDEVLKENYEERYELD